MNAGETAQQSTWMVSGTQPSFEKAGVSAQPKEMFSQWSDSSLRHCLYYWLLLAVTISGTYWSWTLS